MKPAEFQTLRKKANIAQHGLGYTCWEGQLELFAKLVRNAALEEAAKEALTAANAVSHAKPETTPAPEGGAITSESAANAVSAKSRSRKQNFNLTPTQLQMIGAGEMDDPRDQRPQATEPSPQKLIALALEGMELHDFNAPEYKISAELIRLNKALSGQAAAPEAP